MLWPLLPTLRPIFLLFIILELVAELARASVFRARAGRIPECEVIAYLLVEVHLLATALVLLMRSKLALLFLPRELLAASPLPAIG